MMVAQDLGCLVICVLCLSRPTRRIDITLFDTDHRFMSYEDTYQLLTGNHLERKKLQ